jgi:hypothetical protein
MGKNTRIHTDTRILSEEAFDYVFMRYIVGIMSEDNEIKHWRKNKIKKKEQDSSWTIIQSET